jgi:uncharacterized RDD family membrane protein YckC
MALPPKSTDKSKDIALNFQPITEGLGFHPFSDGLPYAPMGKTSTKVSTGSGAVVAGPVSYAKTHSPVPSIPTQRPTALMAGASAAAAARSQAPRISVPVARPQVQAPQKTVQTPVTEPSATSLLDGHHEQRLGIVYLFKRLFAYLLDSAFNLALCAAALSGALWKQDLNPELLFSPSIVLISVLFLSFFNWAITTAQEVAFGTSIGKRVFGLALNGSTSAVFLRAFFFLPSIGFGGLGLLWSLFDRRKRCWHDMVVDLQPIEIAKL